MNTNLPLEALRDEEKLSRLLLGKGLLSQQEFDMVRRQCKATGIEMWRVLLNLNLVSSETLTNLLVGTPGEATPATVTTNSQSGTVSYTKPVVAAPAPVPAPPIATIGNHVAVAPAPRLLNDRANIGEGIIDPAGDEDLPTIADQIFQRAFDVRATDIHFDPQDDHRLRVRYRIDGELHDILMIPVHQVNSLISRVKIMANMDIIEKREPQDGHVMRPFNGQTCNMRIATIPTNRGERLVIRILDSLRVLVGLDRLGLEPSQVQVIETMLRRPHGILIVTGPVGSGKTTTLYSCLQVVNKTSLNAMTVEDPVEYNMPGVNQVQVDTRLEWTFPKALRAMLRQDPDVMMVGEVRDDETARIAIRASLTGVMVLTSMHANDAASTVGTLYNYGIPGYLISTSLLGVVAQRLVRKININAYEEFIPDAATRRLLRLDDADLPNLRLRRGRGTPEDFGTGYLGRTGVFEVMEVNDVLRDMIFRETTKEVIREVGIDMGMMPLSQHAINKVIQGITTLEEAYRVALL